MKLLTAFHRLSVVTRLWVFVAGLAAYSALIVAVEVKLNEFVGGIPPNVHSLLGLVLGLLLVFRTNTAYDRWWEGRKLWGQLVNESRNLVIKVKSFVKTDYDDLSRFGHLVAGFARALKDHLRSETQDNLVRHPSEPKHLPVFIILLIYEQLGFWNRQGQVDGYGTLILDKQASAFSDILGACERIRKTPLTASYRIFVQQCIFLYLATLPLGLARDFSYWTVPAMIIIAYFMLGLEVIAHAVEEPFGKERDDLPLDAICQTIEASVSDIVKHDYESVAEDKS